jgi:NAD(P) transhydrogenase
MSNETKNYDLIILGGGPGGIAAASTASESHKTVALVDNHVALGGAGVNTGTIPSKTLRETALALSGLRSRNLYGVDLSLRREVTVGDFLGHEQKVRTAFNTTLSDRLHSHNADVYNGTAVFVDANTISVTLLPPESDPQQAPQTILLHADHLLIATGSSPVRPDLFPFGQGEVYDSDTILKLDRIPKTMAVIGAGVIGSEYGCTFAALGAAVHIVDGRDKLLPFLDQEVSHALAAAMERSGIVFHWGEDVGACTIEPNGGVKLAFKSGNSLVVDVLLVAAGRQSNTEALGLDKAGVKTGKRGVIPVDDNYCTNVSSIYAAGDVIGFPALASTSMEQGRRAVRHAVGRKANMLSPLLPNGIYTIPEVSMVGETEDSLKKQNIDFIVGRARYDESARGRIIGDKDGFLKLFFRRDDLKLVGVHVIGEAATEIVHIGLMAMLTNSTAEIFVEACFNVPTLSALYKTAALNALKEVGV